MLPLGVYTAGESSPLPDPAMLASAGCNTVWLTHCLDPTALSVTATLDYAKRCSSAGLRLVAAPSALHISGILWKQQPDLWQRLIRETLSDWGTAPKPWRWGLGDEPWEPCHVDYLADWRRLVPGQPAVVVVKRGYIDGFRTMGWDNVAHLSYQFLRPGVPGDEDGELGSWLATCRQNAGGWAMGQAFGDPANRRVPTPAEVSWQVYSALACGCRGVFMFCWAADIGPERLTNLAQLPEQFNAMAMAYKRARPWGALETARHGGWQSLPGPDGSGYGAFTSPDGSRYVLAVCGPGAAATLSVPTSGWLLRDSLGWCPVWRGKASVKLGAGEGRLFSVW